jgi:hypothetical protein
MTRIAALDLLRTVTYGQLLASIITMVDTPIIDERAQQLPRIKSLETESYVVDRQLKLEILRTA